MLEEAGGMTTDRRCSCRAVPFGVSSTEKGRVWLAMDAPTSQPNLFHPFTQAMSTPFTAGVLLEVLAFTITQAIKLKLSLVTQANAMSSFVSLVFRCFDDY